MRKFIVFLILILSNYSFAQTGPAGIGSSDGSIGPENVLWLRSDMGITATGTVSAWADQSGNGNNASAPGDTNEPIFTNPNPLFNNLPTLTFSAPSNDFRLVVPDADNLDNTTGVTVFIVFSPENTSSGNVGILSKRTSFGSNQSYVYWQNNQIINSRISTGGGVSSGSVLSAGTPYIFSSVADAGAVIQYLSTTLSGSGTSGASIPNRSSDLFIGTFDDNAGEARNFEGDIAEVIIYTDALNEAEKLIIENYLSEKYNISVGTDFFTSGDAAFNNDLVGIGTVDGTNKSNLSGFSDALQIEEVGGTLNAANEFIVFAHDNTAHSQTVMTDFTDPDITDRWARSWFLEVTGGVSAELRFDFGTAGLGAVGSASDYVLLYRATTGDNYTRVLANSISIENTDQVVVNLSNLELPTGYYTLGRGTQLVNSTFYSFQSGNWEDPDTWTTDPSGNLLEPPTGNLPSAGDNMVILSGRTVTMATDDNDGVNLTVNGQLNIENTTDHNYFSIAGNGIISIEGSGGIDNFPSGSTSLFADSIVGGTVLMEAGTFNLNTAREYNNVIIDLAFPTNEVNMLADYRINGDLTIQQGILSINDNSATDNLAIDVFGDVQVDASGEINVGTANARHQFNFYGDLINNGRVEFTNRVAADNNNEATNGIVDANFLSDDRDQSIDCNGVTNFYRIEIDKGADETFILDINALSPTNFNLFGPVDYGHSSTAQLTTNDNALGLLRGTVRLNTNVDVPLLNNTGNYNISESARLWVNGGSTTKAGGEAIVPYGIIQVSDGTLDAPVRSGITTRDNGTIIVEGGIVTVNQIRTSVLGAANIGGYFQSGGTVDVTGQNVQQNYYTFSLTYPGNTFNMSGGTLRVAGSDTFNDNTGGTSGQIHGGGIFIDSDPGNISVTGGTVIMENNTNIDFKVTSRAPFWNVIMRSTGGTATDIDLASGTSGDNSAGEFETILNPELLVLNDLTVEDGVSFDPNGNDIEVGSDLIIEDGAEWDVPLNTAPSAPYTLTLNGIDDSVLRLDHATQVNCPTCPVFSVDQRFSNLVINKPDGIRVRLDASAQRDTEIAGEANPDANNLVDVRGTFDLQNGIFDITDYSLRLNTTDVRIDGILSEYVEGVTDVNSQVKFRAATFMVQNTADAVIGNLRFRASNDIVTLQNDLTVRRLQFESGLLNIEDNNLRVENFVEALRASEANFGGCVGGCYSIEDMIVTSASASDGGLSILVDGDGTYEFPFGITNPSSKYTPAVVSVSGFGGDGYLTIRPVDGELLTTEPLGGDVLSYYWRVNFEGFSAVPNVSYQFIYDEDDVDLSANESSFVAGKVLDAAPFTRRFEDDNLFGVPGVVEFEGVDDTNNTIDFNGDADNGFPLEVANYTAGESGRFSGAPTIYYTRKISNGDQDWSNINTWSTTAVQGPVAGTIPGAGDVVIIGAHNGTGLGFSQNPIRLDVDINATVARLEFETAGAGESRGRLFPEPGTSQNWGQVIGNGEIQLFFSNSGDVPTFDATNDLGDFLGNTSSTWNLAHQGGTGTGNAVTMPSFPAEFPNLRITATGGSNGGADGWGSQRIITFTNDIQVNNELQIANRAALWVQSNINVDDDLDVGIGFGHGRLRFDNGNTPYTVTVCNNITVGGTTNGTIDDSFIDVESAGTGTAIHRLQVGGDINLVQNGNGTDGIISLSNPDTDDSQVIIELIKEGANQLANGTDQTPDFYRIEMNKGVDPSSSFEFISNLNINGSSGLIEKAIELNNGLLRFNDPSISIELTTGGGSFSIPSSSGLQLTQGTFTVSGDDIGIILDGSLIIDGGTLDMDDAVGNGNNFIEYSASGNALLEISSGTLNVGSQIRGITTAETGVLRYRQTGGDVRIGTQAGPENTRGMLQIYNTGSEFTFTGGTLQIERHQSSPSVAALFLNPDDSDVTQPIQIFNGDTPAGQNDFRINSAIPLQELVIGGTNSPSAELDINALTIEGNLTIEAGGTLNANGRTLTVGGDFDNDGTYDAQSNETIFNSTGVQQITGAGFFNFFRFTKSETGTLDLTSTLNVSDLFTISGGILSDNGNTINLAADAVIDGTHSSTGGNGIVFSGGTAQELRRSSAGTGTLGTITINNSNGVNIPDGNGYNFNIDGGLRLENGVFNVGGSEILFGISAEITEVNTFGVNNMIRTNSSFTDGGVGKVFAAGPRADFIFPVGQSFFTPVTLTALNIGSTGGTINILPANEVHPTINDGVPDPDDPLATGDVNNALQYYWTVRSSGLNGFTAEANFQYDQSDVLTAEPGLDEDDYIAARILSQNNPTFAINKFLPPPDDLDETNNIITFRFNSVSSDGISGDYFAGIDEAIPDVVVTYIVQGVGGDANTEVYDLDVPGVGNYPSGSVVIIPSGATLTLPVGADGIRLYAMEIQDGGILEIDNSTNHRLGELTGTGTLRILGNSINANLPAFSGDFLSCSGGGLEYGGTGSYSVLGGITEIRNLSFIGSGDRDLPNNNVRVCEDLVVNGPTLNLVPFRRVDVDNDFIINNGVVNSGTSFTTILNDFNIFGGTYEAQNGGNLRIVGDLTINGGTYIAGSAGNLRLEGDLNYTSGLYTQGSGSHRIFMQGVTPQIIRGDFIGSSAFYRLQISNPSGVLLENANIQIQNVLFLFDGLLTTSGFSLSLLSNGITVPTIGSSTSYINGQLNKVVSSSGSSFTFPIGSASRWRPASVNNVSDGGLTWSAEYFDASATTDPLVDNLDATNGGTGPGQIQTVSNGEYWIISDDAGTTPPPGVTATVGLSWGSDSDVSPVFAQREELEVMIWNDGLSSWDNLDGTGFSSGHTQSEGRFTAISSNSFSQQIFTLGSTTATNALPVELLKFEGETLKGNNYLTWETASELNNDFFELQRSSDGFDYETIARVDGQGTTVQITKYEYVDSNPLSGFNYYRLTQTDIDGTITIYNSAEWIVLLTITSEEIEFGFKAYPNPTDQNNINLKVDADQNLPLTIQMVDIYGRIVFQKLFEAGEFTRDMRIDASQNLRQGVYIIVAEQNSKRLTKRVIISE